MPCFTHQYDEVEYAVFCLLLSVFTQHQDIAYSPAVVCLSLHTVFCPVRIVVTVRICPLAGNGIQISFLPQSGCDNCLAFKLPIKVFHILNLYESRDR